MDQAFMEGLVQRFNKLERLEPGWNHYDLQHLWFLLSYYHCDFDDIFYSLLSDQDWQGLHRYFYQHNRLDIFPTYVPFDNPPGGCFFQALTAIAVGDGKSVEHLFPAGRSPKEYAKLGRPGYPLNRVGEILLAGIWYQDAVLLEDAIPKAEKFIAGKSPKWEIAAIAYLLALQEHDVARANGYLEDACKVLHTDFTPDEKAVFVPAHGLYRLAARVLDENAFKKLSMPDYKTFSKGYAKWCNQHKEPPQLYARFPEPVGFLNELLTADWREIPWEVSNAAIFPLPAQWLENC